MIKVTILYPRTDGSHFDIGYYCDSHMPMVKACFGDACKGLTVEGAITEIAETGPQPFHATGRLYCETLEQFNRGFAEHREKILRDVANYTNTQPVIQIGEVMIA